MFWVCKLIMELSKNKNPKNGMDGGDTPLHMAAYEGYLDIFKYIVEHVTDKNPSNDYGETPFQYALENDHYNVVDYIFKHGNQGCQGLCSACK